MEPEKLGILRIIFLSLIAGLLLFALATSTLIGSERLLNFYVDTKSLIVMGLMVACIAAAFFVCRALDKATEESLRGSGTVAQIDEQLFDRFQHRTIVGCALLEGGTFLLLVVNFFRPNFLFLVLTLVMVAAISFYFPTKRRVQQWHRRRREGITQKKSLN